MENGDQLTFCDRDRELTPKKDPPAYLALSNDEFEHDDERAYRCGFGQFRPDWLQRFATSRMYGLVFGILGVAQGAFRAYMVGTLSTLEKRFSISSQMSSIILVADDFSSLLATALFLLFLRRTSMPNWISVGILLSVIGALASYLPYAIFGPGTHLLKHAGGTPGSMGATPLQFCADSESGRDLLSPTDHCATRDSDWSTFVAVGLLITANFLNGLAGVACYVVGTTYMDDNVKRKNSALYFGAIQVLRRLAKNPLLVFRTLSSVVVYIGLTGYYMVFPKYAQHQFQQTASTASLFAGSTMLFSNIIGTIAGAIYVQKWQPRPRVIAWHCVIVTVLATAGIAAVAAMDCNTVRYPSTMDHETGSMTLENSCMQHCSCSSNVHRPVCDTSTGIQYFSSCFAGCTPQTSNDSILNDCHCLVDTGNNSTFHSGSVKSGQCEQDCWTAFIAFSALLFAVQVCYSTAMVGSTLLLLRSLNPLDKGAALCVLSAVMNVFAFIPYPLIYGALADASCLLWEDKCGERGACWLYDLPKFRFTVHGVTAALLVLGCLLQAPIVHYSGHVTQFYDDYAAVENQSWTPTSVPLNALPEKEDSNDDSIA
ncbi:solute carrier organic anion transporter family member 74D-like [Haemaphysalis longicornis]